jgi:hypothetical protein
MRRTTLGPITQSGINSRGGSTRVSNVGTGGGASAKLESTKSRLSLNIGGGSGASRISMGTTRQQSVGGGTRYISHP